MSTSIPCLTHRVEHRARYMGWLLLRCAEPYLRQRSYGSRRRRFIRRLAEGSPFGAGAAPLRTAMIFLLNLHQRQGDPVMRTILALGMAGLLATPAFAADMPTLTQDSGAPVGDNQHSKAAGPDGGVLLEDFHLIEKLARFDRERIPERVVHARGTGAQGSFVASTDFSQYTKASLFAAPGKETPVFVRFSTVIHPKGSPEALRDPRGFATKFYTDQGNWDLVGNDLPVFFIRDAIKFPDMVHSLKPSPVSNVQDPNRFFDFFSHIPESTNMLTYLYSDLGTPASYREMDGFGVHAFKFVNAKGEVVFAKFHWKSQQGVKTLSAEEATAADFNYATKDLYANIRSGNLPKWDLYVQLLKPEDIAKLDYNAFDATKIWEGVPEMKLGTMTLNRVPENFFQSTELVAFSPGVMVTGIEASPDRLLQGRLFSYADTQRYRIGANYQSLPVNRPLVQVANSNQDGALNFVERTGDLDQVKSPEIKEIMVSNFYKSDREYGTRLAKATGIDVKLVEKMAAAE